MKNIYILILLSFLSLNLFAQLPQSFRYQTVIRNSDGTIKANKIVSIKVSLLQGSASGTETYVETHNITTNELGIVNLSIGEGTVVKGTFTKIDWSKSPYFLKIDLDITGGNNYQFMGTSQLLSVPYALYAERSNTSNADTSSTNELQTIARTGTKITLSQNGGTVSIADNDNDSLNEIQILSKNGNQIQLSKNGGNVTDVDNQTLTINGNQLTISNGNSVTFAGAVDMDADPTNEIQSLTYNKDTIKISKANQIVLPHDNDRDSTNEIQTLKIKNDSLYISKSNSVNLKPYLDNTDNQQLSVKGNKLSISTGNTVSIDADTTNEIQSLTYANDTLSISKANNVYIPQPFSFDYPDGFQNIEPFTLNISNGKFIQNKKGYNLYITNGDVSINNIHMYCGFSPMPLILNYNDTLEGTCNGFYIKQKVIPFTFSGKSITFSNNVVVLNIIYEPKYSVPYSTAKLNSQDFTFTSHSTVLGAGGLMHVINTPFFFKKGDNITVTNSTISMNGYILK